MKHNRGNIKWVSLMLPEHVEMLRKVVKEDEKPEKPELDPQQIEYYHGLLQTAVAKQCPVLIHIYADDQIITLKGIPTGTDSLKKKASFTIGEQQIIICKSR